MDFFSGAGSSARRRTHFLCFAKESKQRKATPTGCVPPLRCGQPAVLTFRGVSSKLASLKQGRALIRETLRSSAHPEGAADQQAFAALGIRTANIHQPRAKSMEIPTAAGAKRTQRPGGRATRWPDRSPSPSGCAEERSVSRIRARSCLSEASSARPRETRAPQVARSEAKGRRQWGRLSLLTFFGEAKKVSRPPGRVPASGSKKKSVLHLTPPPQSQETANRIPHREATPHRASEDRLHQQDPPAKEKTHPPASQ
jgi:hypothetical protein